MPTQSSYASLPFASSFLALALVACSGGEGGGDTSTSASSTATTSASSAGAGGAGGAGTGGSAETSTTTTTGSAGATSTVTFTYAPEWDGVTAVSVIGGFGKATDWDPTNPLVKLTKAADGTWTGKAELPAGAYAYIFQVIGDAAANNPMTYSRYALDPLAGVVACPSQSPTHSDMVMVPCSQRTFPASSAPEPRHHIKGTVTYDGKPIAGYLVEMERTESGTHHFFENRTATAADGSFDLVTGDATVRLSVEYPTLLQTTDAQRDPVKLAAYRRLTASGITVSADITLTPVDVAYHDYAKLAPTVTAKLPTTFQFTLLPGAKAARVAIYGTGPSIGDPWYTSPYGTATSVAFDGTFNTDKATTPNVQPGTTYAWGTSQQLPPDASGTSWTGESMVFPITWH